MSGRYYVLTMDRVLKEEPCTEGRDFAEQVLPLVLSADPEENIAIVEALMDRCEDSGLSRSVIGTWASWLHRKLGRKRRRADRLYVLNDADVFDDNGHSWQDVYQIAQVLAWIADHQTSGK